MSLKKVATATDLSVSTISRVLNGKSCVAEATQHKVLAMCNELGIYPKLRGKRASSTSESNHPSVQLPVAILVDASYSTTFLSELVVTIQRMFAGYGHQCLLHSFSGEYADFVRVLRLIQPPSAEACIALGYFTNREVEAIVNASRKCVFVDYLPPDDLRLPINIVSHDNLAAGRLATEQLVAAGCKKPACLQGVSNHHFSRAMREGFLLGTHQKQFNDGQLFSADWTPDGARKTIRAALAAGADFDGLFTMDEMAFGAIRAIKEAGKRIPADIKVMGCDGIKLGAHLHPPLSTVVLNREILGQRAVRRLMEIMNSEEPTCEKILLSPRLEIRGTCVPEEVLKPAEAETGRR